MEGTYLDLLPEDDLDAIGVLGSDQRPDRFVDRVEHLLRKLREGSVRETLL